MVLYLVESECLNVSSFYAGLVELYAGVALDHLVGGLEAGVGDLGHGQLLVEGVEDEEILDISLVKRI